MKNAKLISVMAAAVMISSLTACGNFADTAKSAEQSTASEVTAETEDDETVYADEEADTGYVIRNWVEGFDEWRKSDTGTVWVNSLLLDESKKIYGVSILAFSDDLPEESDEQADEADYESVIYFPTVLFSTDESIAAEDMKAAYESYMGEKTEDEFTAFSTFDGMTMYQLGTEPTVIYAENASEETKTIFETMAKNWEKQRAEGGYKEFQGASAITFQTVDYDGNEVDESVFRNAKITMVNVWATTCSYCISEFPELQELNDNLEDVQVITILSDVSDLDDDAIEDAHDAAAAQGMTLPVLLTNADLAEIFKVTGTPTSYLVDENGNIIGRPKVGKPNGDVYETYAEWIQEGLKSCN